MNRDPQQSGASGDEESWESLAENLFGIEFRKIPDPGEIISPEDLEEIDVDDLAGIDDEIDVEVIADEEVADELTPETSEESSEEDSSSDEIAEETKEDTYWDALKDWSWDESEDRGEAAEGDAPARGRGPKRRDDRSGRPQRDQRGSRRDDRDTRRSRPIDPSVVASRDVPTTSDLRAEYVEDSDFGSGLLEEDQAAEPRREPPSRTDSRESSVHAPTENRSSRESSRVQSDWGSKSRREPPAKSDVGDDEFGADLEFGADRNAAEESGESAEGPTEKAGDSDRERGPRRRRRRRRRGPREPEARTESSPVEDRDTSFDVEEDDVEIIEEGVEVDEGDDSEASSAGETGGNEPREGEENRPRRRRRGRRRGRGRDDRARDDRTSDDRDRKPAADSAREEDSPQRAAEPVAEQAEGWDEDAEEGSSEGDDDLDAVPSYSNVPTWEQAISYLLNPGQAAKERESESGGTSSGKPAGDGRRPRRGRGRRR